jgi:hypothetical protein
MDRKLRNVARQPISGRTGKVWGKVAGAALGLRRHGRLCAVRVSIRILISHRQARASSCAHVRLPAGRRIPTVSLFTIHSAHLLRYVSRRLMADGVKTETLAAQAESHRERGARSRERLTSLLESSHTASTSCRPDASTGKDGPVINFCRRVSHITKAGTSHCCDKFINATSVWGSWEEPS